MLTMLEAGDDLPAPRDLATVAAPDDGFTSYVTCNVDPYKDTRAVKKTLTIPAWLNDRAIARGINFSQALQEALLAAIQN